MDKREVSDTISSIVVNGVDINVANLFHLRTTR